MRRASASVAARAIARAARLRPSQYFFSMTITSACKREHDSVSQSRALAMGNAGDGAGLAQRRRQSELNAFARFRSSLAGRSATFPWCGPSIPGHALLPSAAILAFAADLDHRA